MHQDANTVPTIQDIQPTDMESIARLVASAFRITVGDLRGSSRRREICRPRQVAMFLIREYYGKEKSYPMIGRWFGHKDHTSALHAWRLIPELMEKDVKLCGEVNKLRAKIRSEANTELENCVPQQLVAEPDTLIVIPESLKPTIIAVSPHASLDVIEVVATYFSIDSRLFQSEPDKNNEYLYYSWQVYTHIAKLINEGGLVSERAFKNHLMFVPDLLMRKDIGEIWSQLIKL